MDGVTGGFLWDMKETSVIRCVIVIVAIMHSRIVSGLHVLVLSTSCRHVVSWSRCVTREDTNVFA